MSTVKEPKHRGTLVCVVLKAKNLPNKRSIGKQDPYCVLQMGTEQHKTKPDKRGGQHPTWDEQLHFEIYDDMEDQLRKQKEESDTIKQSSLSTATAKKKDKSGKTLRVTCYADDNKEPEFIGEGVVDLTDTLRSGEFDEWVTIKAKDRYAGEVYLELTFYSSAAPPKPKKTHKPYVGANTTYGGAGTFSEDFDESEFAPRPPAKQNSGHAPIPSGFIRGGGNGGGISSTASQSHLSTLSQPPQHPLRGQSSSSMSSSRSHAQFGSIAGSESVPSSLRPSASLAQIDTYTPPYAPPHIQRERSPAPTSAISPSQDDHRKADSFSALGPSPSAQFYGHRLPDAAPSTIVAQRMQDDLRRHSQQLSASETYQHLPNSNSVATIRQSDGVNLVDDLVGPMSSISMQQIPQVPGTGESGQPQQYQQTSIGNALSTQNLNQYPPYQPQPPSHGQPHAPSPGIPVSTTVDQFGRTIATYQMAGQSSQGNEQSYTYGAPPVPIQYQPPSSPAPPVPIQYQPPSSPAPPSGGVYVTSPTYADLQPHPAQGNTISHSQSQAYMTSQSSSHLNPSPSTAALRPSSPAQLQNAPPPPPPRTHTPGGYHTLPTPPAGQPPNQEAPSTYPAQQYQQVPSNAAQYPPAPISYSGHSQVAPSPSSVSPPKPLSRPLPSTTPTPTPPISNAAPPASYIAQGPPPDGYYYGAPQAQTTWNAALPPHPSQTPQIPAHPIPSPSPQPNLQQHIPPQPYSGQVSYPPQQTAYAPAYNGQIPPQSHVGYVQPNAGMASSMSTSHIVHYPPPPPGPKPSEYAGHPAQNPAHPHPTQPMGQQMYQPYPQAQHVAQQPGVHQGMTSAPSQQFTATQPQYYYHTNSPAPAPY